LLLKSFDGKRVSIEKKEEEEEQQQQQQQQQRGQKRMDEAGRHGRKSRDTHVIPHELHGVKLVKQCIK